MKNSLWKNILLLTASLPVLFFSSCKEDEIPIDEEDVEYFLGWIGDQENMNELESDINLSENAPSTNLPASADLVSKFPPIGNQGQYGTCVAWACAYNLKSFLEGKDKNLTSSQLAQTSNQFSPKDLFWAVPVANKGEDCNGMGFEYALDVMVSRGIAKLSTVPYTDLGDCSSSPQSSWDTEANQYKLENYRKIDIDVNTIKGYLADDRPVVIGAKLGDNFMNWNSDDVITSDNDTYNGQHAYHAMILGGYDNSKGQGAFRVINSWGTTWGGAGYIWVDYNFFVSQFCFAAFVAGNVNSDPDYNPDNVDNTSGKDLVGWALADSADTQVGATELDRVCAYNVYNCGQENIPKTARWNIVYLYYNAYNAEDYGILLYDYYTEQYCSYSTENNGNLAEIPGITPEELFGASGNWWNCIDIPSGMSVADALYGGEGNYFKFYYSMPSNITGYYYLVMIADGFDVLDEFDESNNYLYWGYENGDPLYIENGVVANSVKNKCLNQNFTNKPGLFAKSPFNSVRTATNVNSYSTDEIGRMLKHHFQTGEIQGKLKAFTETSYSKNIKIKGKI
ncbi:MAG: C1 family peptidase [Bacteroidia bacterium]|nr:C1 family peptidase [Bacteroidia bacterium]